jgi:hypothetical protein
MKKTCSCILFGLFLVMNCATAQAITIGFVPLDSSVYLDPNGIFSVELVISGLGDSSAPSLGTFDVDVSFDPEIIELDLEHVTFGNQLGLGGFGSESSASITQVGTLNLFELSYSSPDVLDTQQADGFTLASIPFATLMAGTSGLVVSVNFLGDSLGDPLMVETTNGSVTVAAPVPEPSTLLLLASGLAGLVGFRRKIVVSSP